MDLKKEHLDDLLGKMRKEADPPADGVLAALIAEGGIEKANRALSFLSGDGTALPAGAPPVLAEFVNREGLLPPWADMEKIRRAQVMFTSQGPNFGLVLMAQSLPSLYAGGKGGAQTLYGTGQLSNHFRRRASQTLRFILDVMEPGGLEPGGKGIPAILKVRLMHAAVRHYARHSDLWKGKAEAWGEPINQVELTGTLLAFSAMALEGLRKLDLAVPPEDRACYLHAWAVVGTILGIRKEMIPPDMETALVLWDRIVATQFVTSPEGRALAQDHLAFLEDLIPGELFDGFPPTLMYFLMGRRVAVGMLGLPGPGWTYFLVMVLRRLIRLEGRIFMRSATLQRLASEAGRILMESLYRSWNRGDGSPFRIPAAFRDENAQAKAQAPG